MSDPLVVEVERSGLVESSHAVDVAVVGEDGEPLAWAGDPSTTAYLRSSAKPFQALACLENGWRPPGSEQIAIACGSHNGEPPHLRAVRVTLEAAGVGEDALRCPAAWPFLPEAAASADAARPILHNCSGKHAAMIATCVVNGWPLDDYRSGSHPMQRAVISTVERLAGRPCRHLGVDGCGVQTHAFSLLESAGLFRHLAKAGKEVIEAMAAHPFLVAGTSRACTAIMDSVAGVVVKTGAEGLFCGLLRAGRRGFAVKARDGGQRASVTASIKVLRLLGAIIDEIPRSLAPYESPPVPGGGERVGSIRCRGTLERAL